MKKSYVKEGLAVVIICLLMLISIPVVSCSDDSERIDTSFGWAKSKIFFNCHIEVIADEEKGVAEVGNAPPILVWSTEFGTVEVTTPFRHKTITGRTKGIMIYSVGPYGNDPFYINRDAALCIITTLKPL